MISLSNVMAELQDFNLISNFKINYSKLEILPLNISVDLCARLQSSFSFTWCNTSLKYLGIYLPPHCPQLNASNYTSLLSTIRADLQKWDSATCSWMGRVSMLKMNVLPWILFYLQMIPIPLPRSFFWTLNSLFLKYIWHGRSPRLTLRTLQCSKQMGSMVVPVIRKYYEAIILQQILERHHGVSAKLWIPLEKFQVGQNLARAPWVLRERQGLSEYTSPVTTTLNDWGRLAPSVTPLAPLGGFPLLLFLFLGIWWGNMMWQVRSRPRVAIPGCSQGPVFLWTIGVIGSADILLAVCLRPSDLPLLLLLFIVS